MLEFIKKRFKNDNKIPNFRNDEKILPITNQMNLFLKFKERRSKMQNEN